MSAETFFPSLAVLCHMEFLGQGLNLSWSCNLHHSCSNAGSLTHCAGLGIEPLLPLRQMPLHFTTAETPAVIILPVALNSLRNSLQFFFFFFLLFRAALVAYESSQAGGRIRATAASRHHSHSNTGSKPRLKPTPQLMATSDP